MRAYEAGADQHLRADAGYLLVRAVIEAAHRRVTASDHARRHYRIGALHIDTATREVRAGDARLALSAKEYALLRHLAAQPTRVFTKEELLRDVWGYRSPGRTRTLDAHVISSPDWGVGCVV